MVISQSRFVMTEQHTFHAVDGDILERAEAENSLRADSRTRILADVSESSGARKKTMTLMERFTISVKSR
jgi:hypothetical protein